MRHHYIPCFYTKRWTGVDKRLCEYSRPYKTVVPKRVYPAGTGYVDDLYAIPHTRDEEKHLVETKFMQTIDQKASDIILKLESNGTSGLTSNERISWAIFLISIMQRSPEKIDELKYNADYVFEKILPKFRRSYPDRRSVGDPETFDELLKIARNAGYFERSKILLIQDTILLKNTANLICNFHWGICSIDKYQHELLTSDRPVIMSNGLGKSDGYIAIPVGPRKLFLAGRTPEISHMIMNQRGFVEAANEAITRNAQKFVYGTSDGQLPFVERRLRKRAA